ncbi:hypothetical protein K227x_41580 [Rubripirellula lacrimiformis]|uniref:Uncharacterized protein n=1 Tax=Rubripirellula lacrimiformis TaxID=1930273 RepID=A0A517NF40_9BACT|nr:hypothetical protein K227x_41580 [Rubripirellula lacrimiformis]
MIARQTWASRREKQWPKLLASFATGRSGFATGEAVAEALGELRYRVLGLRDGRSGGRSSWRASLRGARASRREKRRPKLLASFATGRWGFATGAAEAEALGELRYRTLGLRDGSSGGRSSWRASLPDAGASRREKRRPKLLASFATGRWADRLERQGHAHRGTVESDISRSTERRQDTGCAGHTGDRVEGRTVVSPQLPFIATAKLHLDSVVEQAA